MYLEYYLLLKRGRNIMIHTCVFIKCHFKGIRGNGVDGSVSDTSNWKPFYVVLIFEMCVCNLF